LVAAIMLFGLLCPPGRCTIRVDPDLTEVYLDEIWNVYAIDQDYNLTEECYEVNAWYRHDWNPLSEVDIKRFNKIQRSTKIIPFI
jgi:hypothetical protein